MRILYARLVRWLARREIEQMAGEIRRLRETVARLQRVTVRKQ
jgi:hypothetical protein